MTPELEQAILSGLKQREGLIHWPYCDNRGNVTIGIGHLVPSLAAMKALTLTVEGRPASSEEKESGWVAVVNAYRKGLGARAYLPLTSLRMDKGVALTYCKTRLTEEFLPPIRKVFHAWDSFPLQAQVVVLDIAYNCGAHWMNGFPRFVSACQAKDWEEARRECLRSDARRKPTAEDPEGLGPRNRWAQAMLGELIGY